MKPKWGNRARLTTLVVAGLAFHCAHAPAASTCGPGAQTESEAAGPAEEPVPPADDAVLGKMDARLRFQMAGKLDEEIAAVAQLSAPLAPEVIERLRLQGLRILRADDRRLHVQGDRDALIRLAARREVVRMASSGPVRPLPDSDTGR